MLIMMLRENLLLFPLSLLLIISYFEIMESCTLLDKEVYRDSECTNRIYGAKDFDVDFGGGVMGYFLRRDYYVLV